MQRLRQTDCYDFEVCKACAAPSGRLSFRLERSNVYVCRACGFHYTDHLDPIEDLPAKVDRRALTRPLRRHIETQLHANEERLARHVALLTEHVDPAGALVLDVGCGGGRFLASLREAGARVYGIELDDARAAYTRKVHGIEAVKHPIEHAYWQQKHVGAFDAITLWDVIEHVNFPLETLTAAVRLLKPGGVLLLDTPMRDAVYHRVGTMTYRLTRGRLPTFLNLMYSNQLYGHKQILSTRDMKRMLDRAGLELVALRRLHELSFPYRFYLRTLLRSERLAELAHPWVVGFFRLFRLRNKMIVVARRPGS